jgi:hypothetical protein
MQLFFDINFYLKQNLKHFLIKYKHHVSLDLFTQTNSNFLLKKFKQIL